MAPVRYSEQMPAEALRDLLGIVRVMFAQLTADKGDPIKLQELTEIGKLLRGALADSKLPAGCLGHRNGWDRAQEAVQRLSLLVTEDAPRRPLALAAGTRVLEGGKPGPIEDREAKRAHRAKR